MALSYALIGLVNTEANMLIIRAKASSMHDPCKRWMAD